MQQNTPEDFQGESFEMAHAPTDHKPESTALHNKKNSSGIKWAAANNEGEKKKGKKREKEKRENKDAKDKVQNGREQR